MGRSLEVERPRHRLVLVLVLLALLSGSSGCVGPIALRHSRLK